MKKTAKMLLCLLLISAFCLSMLVGCGGTDEPQESESETAKGTEVEDITSETESQLNTEDTLEDRDFGGADYRILTREDTDYEFDPTANTETRRSARQSLPETRR